MSLADRLAAFIAEVTSDPARLYADTPLITSGRVDSLSLLQLMCWIEGETGALLDLTSVDLAREWNTLADILRFIEARRV